MSSSNKLLSCTPGKPSELPVSYVEPSTLVGQVVRGDEAAAAGSRTWGPNLPICAPPAELPKSIVSDSLPPAPPAVSQQQSHKDGGLLVAQAKKMGSSSAVGRGGKKAEDQVEDELSRLPGMKVKPEFRAKMTEEEIRDHERRRMNYLKEAQEKHKRLEKVGKTVEECKQQ
mmetsp:Transcript_58939/g.133085  ORF Transcript_58939/g.133085 Transcript_58939/m.133085 type:complete len:171 (-) Transcript_58939:416-928(-)